MTPKPGDPVRTTYCHEPVDGTILEVIADSQPAPKSKDLLCRVQCGERVLLRRISELSARCGHSPFPACRKKGA